MPNNGLNDKNVLQNGLPTIAILAGSVTSVYQESIVRGVAHIAAQKNYNMISFCGGVIKSTFPLALAREEIFNLVDMDSIAGIISPFSSHMRFLNDQERQAFIDRFSSVPVVNIGSNIAGLTNIEVDYEPGLNELFDHFYSEHGYRKILFLSGPKTHASSIKRLNIYKKLLKKYQLPFDENMVIHTDLRRDVTQLKVGEFLDSTNLTFDAIISVNDNQAMGAMDACQQRGINVPEDVAIAGSMNTLEGAFTTPSLTSVTEPIFELGQAAAIALIKQIEGNKVISEIQIPTSLMIRQSCGCKSTNEVPSSEIINSIDTKPVSLDKDPIFQETQIYFEKIVDRYKGGMLSDEVTSILSLFQQAIYKNKFDQFLKELQKRLENSVKSEDFMLWLAITTKLQINTLHYSTFGKDTHKLHKFSEKLITLKNHYEQIAIEFQRFEGEYYLNYFKAVVNNLNFSFDLMTIKKDNVDVLQLSELYISIFHDLDADILSATNLLSIRNNKFITLDNKDYFAKNLLPPVIEPYQERFSLMVLPLSFRNKAIGFMVFNLNNCKGAAFENLRTIVSTALKNEMLIQDLKKAEERFSDIAHSASNWLWETDINNQFIYCSKSSKDIIGYPPEILLGKEINELNIESGDGYIKSMRCHEDLIDVECWYQHQNGSVICLLIAAKPIITNGEFTGYRGIFEDITEQKLQAEKIKTLAYSDILTGLPNRTLFQEKLAETISFSARNSKKFALMFIDLDHFKHINDSMGHASGDLLLIKVADRILQSIRSVDMLARLGGDEFIIILPDIADEAGITDIVERIFNNIKKPIIIHDKPVTSTLSLGISVYPTDGIDAQSLLQKGDNAMYQAKEQGRNGYVFYDKLLEEKHALRNMYEGLLREAIATNGFVVHYQPQVSVETGKTLGFEALVRIKSKQQGLIEPNNFIPLAEELGLINHVDEWVFESVCAQYAACQSQGIKPTRFSVNLSALHLRDNSVLDNYMQIIERYNVKPSDIQLEITENALIENATIALTILEEFKRYGFSIALDDFGTGYSSLNCINLYPIDTIKIDRSFVVDAVDNPKNKAIIQGIVLMASSLDLKIIAEGVETKQQYDFIKQLHCHEIQGYYFYEPLSIEEIMIPLN